MSKKAKYICYEGTEGVGKTTQLKKLAKYLRKKGYSVLETKDIGSPLLKTTKKLRSLMLNNKFSPELSSLSRELLSNAMRSIHLEKVIDVNLHSYDFIIQDRGFLSSLSYGEACENDVLFLRKMIDEIIKNSKNFNSLDSLYDHLIVLSLNPKEGLNRAQSAKNEFKEGDAMESLGSSFMEKVKKNFDKNLILFNPASTHTIDVYNKSIDQVFSEVLKIIEK